MGVVAITVSPYLMLLIDSAALSEIKYNEINLPQANWYTQELSSFRILSL